MGRGRDGEEWEGLAEMEGRGAGEQSGDGKGKPRGWEKVGGTVVGKQSWVEEES